MGRTGCAEVKHPEILEERVALWPFTVMIGITLKWIPHQMVRKNKFKKP